MKYLIGNWKMNGSLEFTRTYLESVGNAYESLTMPDSVAVVHCPPALYAKDAVAVCSESSIAVGAQDCHYSQKGAFTGNMSAAMIKDIGCWYVIIGHSERRMYHHESNEIIADKVHAAISQGLQPVLCIGETEEERDSGDYQSVLHAQLSSVLTSFTTPPASLIVAYEPVWAIGTGRVANVSDVDEACSYVHALCKQHGVEQASVLYGGSVKSSNAADILSITSVNGVLVGGASIDLSEWTAIMKAAKTFANN